MGFAVYDPGYGEGANQYVSEALSPSPSKSSASPRKHDLEKTRKRNLIQRPRYEAIDIPKHRWDFLDRLQ